MKQINNISSLLRKWLSGDKNAEQSLRNTAQEDTFLRDAMEGFDQFPEKNHKASIERLRGKIAARTQKSKRRTLIWYLPRVAAAAVILLVGTWIIQQQFSSTNTEIALSKSAEQDAFQPKMSDEEYTTALEDAPVETPKPKSESAGGQELGTSKQDADMLQPSSPPTTSTPNITQAESKKKVKPIRETATGRSEYAAPPQAISPPAQTEDFATAAKPSLPSVREEPSAYDADPSPAVIADEEVTPEAAAEITIEEIAANAPTTDLRQANPSLRQISGVVIDASGEPLIGATVLESGTNNSVATDFDGKFKLEVQTESKQLEIAYVGFATQQVNLGEQQEIEIKLEEDGITLDEVAVVGYRINYKKEISSSIASAKHKRSKKKEMEHTKVSREFKRFVKKNKQTPEAARDNNIKGEVILEFDINQEGRPTNFRTIKSLGYGCDEEAMRLLKEGPAWKTSGSQKGRLGIKF